MKIGLFIDTGNLYHALKPAKMNYAALLDYCKDLGTIEVANAYGADLGAGSHAFMTKLQELGYCCKFRKVVGEKYGNPNVEIAQDVAEYKGRIDLLILGSGDGALAPVCLEETMIIGSGISALLPGTKIEVPPSMLL